MININVFKQEGQLYFSIMTILSTVFGMQMLRMLFPSFVGYLRDSVGFSAITLAPIALGLFSLVFMAGPIYKALRPRFYFLITVGGIALVRLIEQMSTSAQFDLVLSSLGVVLFLFYLPLANCVSHNWKNEGALNYGICILLGISIDTALLAGYRTLDLSWQTGIIPTIIVFFIGCILVGCLYLLFSSLKNKPIDGRWRSDLSKVSFGPWLFLQMLVFQNIPRLSTLSGLETPGAAAVVIFGNTAAIFFVLWIFNRKSNFLLISIIASVILLVSIFTVQNWGYLTALLFFLGQIFCAVLFIFLFQGFDSGQHKEGITVISILYGIGYLLFILLMFLYYLTFDIDLGFRAQSLLPLASLLLALGAIYAARRVKLGERIAPDYTTAAISFALILIPISLQLVWKSPEYILPDPQSRSVKVMTYNLHNGFNTDGRLDLEAIARLIERTDPDVIGLQEVSRGWLIWGGVDMLTWLSQRLHMPYVSGPTADNEWGNAVLSRYPLKNIQLKQLPPDELLIRRGFIQTDIDIGSELLNLIVTHFYHLEEETEIREQQSAEIIKNLHPGVPTIMMGDLNATPDTKEIQLLLNMGMVDLAAEMGTPPTNTFYAASPDRQIDYIWISSELQADSFEIQKSTALDHFPVFSTISIP